MFLDRIDDLMHGGMIALFSLAFVYFTFLKNHTEGSKRLHLATGALMLVIALQALEYVLLSFWYPDSIIVHDTGLSIVVNLLVVPFCVFVIMELTRWSQLTIELAAFQVMVPLVLAITYFLGLKYESTAKTDTLVGYLLWMGAYCIYYFYKTIRAVRAYNDVVGQVYADVNGREVNWLGRLLAVLEGIAVLFILLKVVAGDLYIRLLYPPCCMVMWMLFCRYIGRMRNNELIQAEDYEMNEEDSGLSYEEADIDEKNESFMETLHDTLLTDRLYAKEDLNRDIVARKMHTNYKYLTRDLRKATGLTFSGYVTEVRMQEAAKLLSESDMTVEEILFACGYQSKSTFYRAFSKTYGCSPLEYRTKRENSQRLMEGH